MAVLEIVKFPDPGLRLKAKPVQTFDKSLQKLIDEVAKDATVWASEQTDKRAAGRAKIVTDSGTEIVPFNQTLFAQMKATRGPVIDMIKQRIGAELPDLLIQEVDKATAEQNQNTK